MFHFGKLLAALDSDNASIPLDSLKELPHKSTPSRWIPFVLLHSAAFLVIFTGTSCEALIYAIVLYLVRMFAITAFYHRYFSHRSFKTSRVIQFVFAFIGATSCQRGPLWWASHHRHHHQFSDMPQDIHSPLQSGFWWAHIGWITSEKNIPTDYDRVKDFTVYPELVWLNRFDWVPPFALLIFSYALGGWQFTAWAVLSTVILFHCTCLINSLSHLMGSRRYDLSDSSRNNFFLALITLGEGWHNNHHKNPGLVTQGQTFFEIDITYMLLRLMEKLGLVWDLRTSTKTRANI